MCLWEEEKTHAPHPPSISLSPLLSPGSGLAGGDRGASSLAGLASGGGGAGARAGRGGVAILGERSPLPGDAPRVEECESVRVMCVARPRGRPQHTSANQKRNANLGLRETSVDDGRRETGGAACFSLRSGRRACRRRVPTHRCRLLLGRREAEEPARAAARAFYGGRIQRAAVCPKKHEPSLTSHGHHTHQLPPSPTGCAQTGE